MGRPSSTIIPKIIRQRAENINELVFIVELYSAIMSFKLVAADMAYRCYFEVFRSSFLARPLALVWKFFIFH